MEYDGYILLDRPPKWGGWVESPPNTCWNLPQNGVELRESKASPEKNWLIVPDFNKALDYDVPSREELEQQQIQLLEAALGCVDPVFEGRKQQVSVQRLRKVRDVCRLRLKTVNDSYKEVKRYLCRVVSS